MNSRSLAAITQTTGATVEHLGRRGVVVGHYDDDVVYVQFEETDQSEAVYTLDLTLIEKAPR